MGKKNQEKVQKRVEKILQGGSSVERNMIVGFMLMCLVGMPFIVWMILSDPTQIHKDIIVRVWIGVSALCIYTIGYVLWQHGKYRRKLKEKYEALTAEDYYEMAIALQGYEEGKQLVLGKHKLYGEFCVLGKPFTTSYTWINYEDILWAYERRETYPLPFHRNNKAIKNGLILRDREGNGYEMSCKKPYYSEELKEIKRRQKNCKLGYTKENKRYYKEYISK